MASRPSPSVHFAPRRFQLSRTTRLILLGGLVALAVAAFLVLRPAPGPEGTARTAPAPTVTTRTPAPPPVPVIRVRHGKPVGGVRTIEVRRGETIRFRVVSDVADEIH